MQYGSEVRFRGGVVSRQPVRLAVLEAERVLAAAGVGSPRVDAELLAARSMVHDVAARYDSGADTSVGPSSAKLFCTEMVGRAVDKAVQVHGGAGYMRSTAVERFYRDARLFRIYEGTSQIQQLIIARHTLADGS